jgi:carbamoyl-phosphate synthase small subunit
LTPVSITAQLTGRGAHVTLYPCTYGPQEILADDPDAIFLANGPGDPGALDYVVETVRRLIGVKPVYGICLGHQLLCRAVGLETYKMPFGHHGANHPVKDLTTGRTEITSQNHGFAVLGPNGERTVAEDEPVQWETRFGRAALTHVNLYDRTVEGLRLLDVQGATVQYHPEAGPGPNDSQYLFERFLQEIRDATA